MTWRRVNRDKPCPACGHADWCAWTPDGARLKCERVSDARPGLRVVATKDGGAIYEVIGDTIAPPPLPGTARHNGPEIDWEALQRDYTARLAPSIGQLATSLGVGVDALRRLGTGADASGAYTWPMRDAGLRIVGMRRRLHDGRKLSVAGGHEGCFVPDDWPQADRVWVVEGPTDTAALLTVGVEAIGRPSCSGGVSATVALTRGLDVVILADRDETDRECTACGGGMRRTPDGGYCSACRPGQAGAIRLARALRGDARTIRLTYPPPGHKDARDWVRAGATHADFRALAGSAPRLRSEDR